MSNDEKFTILPINDESTARQCASVIAEEFAEQNQFSIFSGCSKQKLYEKWLYPLINSVKEQNLSFYVRNNENNEIVSVIIAHDLFIVFQSQLISSIQPTDDAVADIFDEKTKQFVRDEFQHSFEENQVLWISVCATRHLYSRRGMSTRLVHYLCRYANQSRGFRYGFVQTDHPATRRIFAENLQGQVLSSTDPAKWIWKEIDNLPIRPFEGYKDEPINNILLQLNKASLRETNK